MPTRTKRSKSAPRARSCVLAAIGVLGLASAAQAFCRGGAGFNGFYGGAGFVNGAGFWNQPVVAAPFHPAYYPTVGYELTDEELYAGAKSKGDRNMKRNQFSAAMREYANARNRAARAWGEDSAQAKRARASHAEAERLFLKYGDAKRGKDYSRAKKKGDRFLGRGDYDRAIRQYEDALARAHTDAQAKEASALLVQAQDLKSGRRTRRGRTLGGAPAALGEAAMRNGRFAEAVDHFAAALTDAIRRTGAGSGQVRRLTRRLTAAQRALSEAAPAVD